MNWGPGKGSYCGDLSPNKENNMILPSNPSQVGEPLV